MFLLELYLNSHCSLGPISSLKVPIDFTCLQKEENANLRDVSRLLQVVSSSSYLEPLT